MLQHSNPGLLGDKQAVYLAFIRLLREMDRTNPSGGYLGQILSVMERSKARGFIDSLEEAELGLSAMATPDLQDEETRLSGSIAQLQVGLHYPIFHKPNAWSSRRASTNWKTLTPTSWSASAGKSWAPRPRLPQASGLSRYPTAAP